ncbi:MAG: tetratricopeptide repeat protein [Acidobacteriia bacterium]|nr:tetratricopeptide repeat protein [Terriglobia bacterium]
MTAIENFQSVRCLDPRDTNALLYLAKSQIQVRDYLGAAESLENLRKLKQDDPDVLYSLSVAYLKLMLANVTRLSKAAPDSYQLWLVLAQEAEARGDDPSAANDLEHALRVNPKGVGIHYALGSVLARDAKYQEAKEEFKEELEVNPNDPLALWKIGEITLRTDPQETLGYLERSVRLSPDLPQALLAYGRALARLEETDKAVQQFQQVARLAPEEDSVHYHLSRAYRLLGRSEEAKVEMAKFEALAEKKSERTREQVRQLIELTREEQNAGETPESGFDPSRDPSHP